MRIGILVLMAGRQAGGPETYEVELIRALAAIDRSNEYYIYCSGAEAVRAIGVEQANVSYRVLRPGVRWLSIPFSLPIALIRDRIDLLHATFTPPPRTPVPLVFTMHCMSNFVHPEFYPKLIAWRLNRLQRIGIERAVRVLCVSETLREQVHEAFGTPLDRMSVSYNGVGPEFRPISQKEARDYVRERFHIDYPYVLYVGKIQARKNLPRLLHAFRQFKRETGSDARLVLAGRRTDTAEVVDRTIDELGMRSEVVELGYIPHTSADREALPMLYCGARFFVFVSLWEGFGIPLVEAMACGTPAIVSSVTSLPEIAGDAALVVEPTSVEEIAHAMTRLETSEGLRTELAQKGLRQAKRFNWPECARRTLASYESVVHAGSVQPV